MEESNTDEGALIHALDARQNEVTARLDELNQRIEETIKAWSVDRDDAEAA